jgi:hypothetical protein
VRHLKQGRLWTFAMKVRKIRQLGQRHASAQTGAGGPRSPKRRIKDA